MGLVALSRDGYVVTSQWGHFHCRNFWAILEGHVSTAGTAPKGSYHSIEVSRCNLYKTICVLIYSNSDQDTIWIDPRCRWNPKAQHFVLWICPNFFRKKIRNATDLINFQSINNLTVWCWTTPPTPPHSDDAKWSHLLYVPAAWNQGCSVSQ